MASKFLATGGTQKLDDGTAVIYAASLGSTNLEPSKPVKTNGVLQLVSENLDIGDVNNLATDLVYKTQLEFTEQLGGYVPSPNHQRLYFKTDEKLYKLNSAGVETEIGGGGGGGGISYDAGSVVQGNGIVFRNGTDVDKVKNASYFGLINLPVIGESLLCNDIQLPNVYSVETSITVNETKLTKVSYDGATTTTIDDELAVNKIKNTTGTAEVELETDGKINIIGDSLVKLRANGTTNRLTDYLSLESATDCWMTALKGIYINAFETDNTTPNLTLNAVNGLLTIQAINGNINNLTKGLITLENIPPNPVVERNGFIFNPDDVRVDFNKLDVSKGFLNLDAVNNINLQSTTGAINLSAFGGGGVGVDILAQNGNITLTPGSGSSVLCYNINPLTDNFAVVNKNYLDSRLSVIPTTTPFNLIIAGTDEVNLITTIGEKMEIYAPATITLNRVAFSTTQAGGVDFTAGVYQNGTLIKQMILGGLSYSDQAITPITITKGDIIHIKVIDVGLSTATGLKCCLEGVYQ